MFIDSGGGSIVSWIGQVEGKNRKMGEKKSKSTKSYFGICLPPPMASSEGGICMSKIQKTHKIIRSDLV